MLEHKDVISHKLGILFLGFHVRFIYNDTVVAFGQPEKQILFEPVFAEYIQAASGKAVYWCNYYHHLLVQQLLAGNQIVTRLVRSS
jgi:photosystem I P700 chlorophyll a apoprotein A2